MNKHKLKALILMVGAIFMAFLMVNVTSQASTSWEQGVDWSKYNGNSGVFGYNTDKFVFSQAGGFYGGTNIPQTTYNSQVKSAQQAGKRVHTYLWDGVGGNMTNAKAMMAYYLPRIRTPKGSIVALDYEDGASNSVTANTNVIKAQFELIKAAGYTPMLYSGKAYLNAHVNTSAIVKAYGNCLWLAEYPDYLVRTSPDYNWFPSMDGVAIFQFTSMYKAGGLDGNVDLTGITKSGYTAASKQRAKANKHTYNKSASSKWIKEAKTYTLKTAVKLRKGASTSSNTITILPAGTTVKTDQAVIQGGYRWVRQPRSYGYGYLITGPTSNTLEYVKSGATHKYYTVKYGDSWWSIAKRNGMSMTRLASRNGKTIYTTIYPGQRLVVR